MENRRNFNIGETQDCSLQIYYYTDHTHWWQKMKYWCVVNWLVCWSGRLHRRPSLYLGHHSGHFGAPHTHDRWRSMMLLSHSTADLPMWNVRKDLTQWLSPRQRILVVLQGQKSLVHVCFCSPPRVSCLCSLQTL